MSLPLVEISGPPRECGRQYGEQAPPDGCTSFALMAEASGDGHVYAGADLGPA
ncbi:hypothetical protein ABGB18_42310 [Nonomuraea sp. B12E4]|uniref:hypothetical protein n=1 Tax=Nonomuraea sp. B12E4 TaxID=3153564 RepID=UPI00325C417C